ncbi:DUF1905 domain-containing protein [Cellulomonas composti]|uniref:DUF1905 domain-containing protein n=1 Tax=Cellulomonas composti TaxID=266130 RepID=A0A511JDC4_9CELL|nr:DUF1905 domain-containing protein [Cellulomonas composti]GEL96001.1 hypothetical protein CCO02nite_26590 [Cellulomonas composti]
MELEITGEVWYWRGPAPHHFVTVPPTQADEIHDVASMVTYGWGMIPVRLRMGATVWETSLWPKDGGYLVPLKLAARRAEDVEVGDVVTLRLELQPERGRRTGR